MLFEDGRESIKAAACLYLAQGLQADSQDLSSSLKSSSRETVIKLTRRSISAEVKKYEQSPAVFCCDQYSGSDDLLQSCRERRYRLHGYNIELFEEVL